MDNNNYILVRTYHTDCTPGILYDVDSNILCYTLELPNKNNQQNVSCIPEGTYQFQKFFSQKLGWIYKLNNVPGRDLVRIHEGNTVLDIEGCILVGDKPGVLHINGVNYTAVLNSDATLKALQTIIGTGGTLTITSNDSPQQST